MRLAVQICFWIIGLPLQLLVIRALVRGPYREYPLLFAYNIVTFLISVAEIPNYLAKFANLPDSQSTLSKWYWIDDVILEVLLYALVIALIYTASSRMQSRAMVRFLVTLGAFVFAAVSLWTHYNRALGLGEWMSPWTRDLNFCSTILDLALWTLLISSKARDPRLLMVSGGLGVQFAGGAIGEAMQSLAGNAYRSKALSKTWAMVLSRGGAYLATLCTLACLIIWWQALRIKAASRTEGQPPLLLVK